MSAAQTICAVRNLLILSGIAPWTDWSRLTIFLFFFFFFGEIVCFPISSVMATSFSFPSPAFLSFTLFFELSFACPLLFKHDSLWVDVIRSWCIFPVLFCFFLVRLTIILYFGNGALLGCVVMDQN